MIRREGRERRREERRKGGRGSWVNGREGMRSPGGVVGHGQLVILGKGQLRSLPHKRTVHATRKKKKEES